MISILGKFQIFFISLFVFQICSQILAPIQSFAGGDLEEETGERPRKRRKIANNLPTLFSVHEGPASVLAGFLQNSDLVRFYNTSKMIQETFRESIERETFKNLENSTVLITISSEKEFSNFITSNFAPGVTDLRFKLKEFKLSKTDWEKLFENLKNLRELDIAGNDLGDSGIELIATLLPKTKLTHLDISENLIGGPGGIALAKALPNTSITNLNLSDNYLGHLEEGKSGLEALISVLSKTQIKSLDLGNNQINKIASWVPILQTTKITNLDLALNQITTAEVLPLIRELHLTSIRELHLALNKIRQTDRLQDALDLSENSMRELRKSVSIYFSDTRIINWEN